MLNQNSFNRHLFNIFTDEKKAVICKAPNRVTDWDKITKIVSEKFLDAFLAKEDEQVCSKLFGTRKGFFVGKNVRPFNFKETDDRNKKHEAFFGSNVVKFPFARGDTNI